MLPLACRLPLRLRAGIVVGLVALVAPRAGAQLTACSRDADSAVIADALAAIEHSVDPCGESSDLATMLETLRRCSVGPYEICTDATSTRNTFDRPAVPWGDGPKRITWNPTLRTEIEGRCDRDPARPVFRDPTASLVHELAHAAQDCLGLNPGEHELDAVRLENVYRRAAGLCQRRGYGECPLPAPVVMTCTAAACRCTVATDVATISPPHALEAPLPSTSSGDAAAAAPR